MLPARDYKVGGEH